MQQHFPVAETRVGLKLQGAEGAGRVIAPAGQDTKSFLKQGATGGKVSAGNAPLKRTELSQLVADYQETYASDGGVYATYKTATLPAYKIIHPISHLFHGFFWGGCLDWVLLNGSRS